MLASRYQNTCSWGKDAATALLEKHPKYKKLLRNNGTMLVRVDGALYGLPESGEKMVRCTYLLSHEGMEFLPCKTDNCIFVKNNESGKIMFGLHVDDIYFTATSQQMVDDLCEVLRKEYGDITFESGTTLSFLGMKIKKIQNGDIEVSQPAYVQEITQDIPDVDLPRSPATRDILNNKNLGEPIDTKAYLSRVMKLMFLATKTRSDILFAVACLASRSNT